MIVGEHPEEVSDKYFTKNKREVHDHGGINPDIVIEGDSLNYVLIELIRKNMLFNFAVDYYQHHPEWNENIENDDKLFNEFSAYLKENNFEYETEGNRELEKLKSIASSKSDATSLLKLIDQLQSKLESEKDHYLNENKDSIKRYLKLELAEKYFGRKGRYKYSIEHDPQVKGAVAVLANQSEYKKILAVN